MYYRTGEPIGMFIRHQRQSDGRYYYLFHEDNVSLYMFGNNQFWDGFTDSTDHGNICFKDHGQFNALWTWKRQLDDSLVVFIEIGDKRMGLILVPTGHDYLAYYAWSDNLLEQRTIRDNPNH